MTKLHINPFNVKTGIVPKLNELWQLLFFKFYLLRIFLVVFNEERFPDIFWKKKFMPAVCLVLYVWLISFLCHSYVSVVICVLKTCAGTMCPPAPPPLLGFETWLPCIADTIWKVVTLGWRIECSSIFLTFFKGSILLWCFKNVVLF